MGEVDLERMLEPLIRPGDGFALVKTEHGGQVLGQDAGMKVLLDGQDGFSSEILQFNPALAGFEILFHKPALMIQFAKDFMWITGCVAQGRQQHFGLSRGQLDADQSKRERTDVHAFAQATGFFQGCKRQADDLLAL